MIHSAIKMRSGKTTWIEQKKRLLIVSWIVVCVTLAFIILAQLTIGQIVIIFEYGFVGGLLTLIAYYYDKYTTSREYMPGPALMKEQVIYANPKFCTNCGFDLKGGTYKFCPECGTQLTSE